MFRSKNMKPTVGFNEKLRKRVLYFGRTSGIHGLAHLFRDNANFFARLFWLVVLLASTGCLYLLLVPVIERGAEVNYTPNTLYLEWNTKFPAVTVCENYVPKTTQKRLAEGYPELMASLDFDFKRYLADLVYMRGTCKKSVCVHCGTQIPCDAPWRSIVEKVHMDCDQLIANCSYGGEPFPCCQQFRLADSDQGPCYTFNNLQTLDTQNEELITVNRSTGPKTLTFRILYESRVAVHSSQELATSDLDDKYKFNVLPYLENRVDYLFSLVETENDPLLKFNEIHVRGCRYHHEVPESPFHTYPIYSYGACRLARNTEHAYDHCNCVHPARDLAYKDEYCNFTGLNCLVHHGSQTKLGIENDKEAEEEMERMCKPSCVESELTTIHVNKRWIYEQKGKGTRVNIEMVALPTLRYHRNLVRTNLDLVVSVGGLLGLFFGASVLSLAEIVYLLIK